MLHSRRPCHASPPLGASQADLAPLTPQAGRCRAEFPPHGDCHDVALEITSLSKIHTILFPGVVPMPSECARLTADQRAAVLAKAFVQQEYLPLVQLDDSVLVQPELSQAPDGIGSRPGDPEELLDHHVHPRLTIPERPYGITGEQDLAHLSR